MDEIKAIYSEAVIWPKTTGTAFEDIRRSRTDAATPERNAAAKAVFTRPRDDCPKWFPYTPGLDPEKHLEEYKTRQLEQDRREFERKLFEMEQRGQARAQTVGIWLTIAALILAIAQVLTMTPDSWLWKLLSRLFS
jgi:hypothetical protein